MYNITRPEKRQFKINYYFLIWSKQPKAECVDKPKNRVDRVDSAVHDSQYLPSLALKMPA